MAGAYALWGSALASQDKYDESLKKFQKALDLDPNDSLAHRGITHIFFKRQEFDKVIDKVNEALNLPGASKAQLLSYLGQALYFKDDYEGAVQKLKESIDMDPENQDSYIDCAFAFMNLKRYHEAQEKLHQALKIDSNNYYTYYGLGLSFLCQGQHTEAIDYLEETIKINQKQNLAYFAWGYALYEQQNYERVISKLNKAIEITPDFKEPYFLWSCCLLRKKEYAAAIQKLQKAVGINPFLGNVSLQLGQLLYVQKMIGNALVNFHQAVKEDP